MSEWWADPTIIAVAVFGGWICTQLVSFVAAKWVIVRNIKEAKRFSNEQRDAIQSHFDAQLKELRTSIPSAPNLDGIRADIAAMKAEVDSFRVDFDAMAEDVEAIPQKIQMTILSEKGVETRKIQTALAQAGAEIKDSINLEDAAKLMDENLPDSNATVARALIKDLAKMSVTDEWAAEHPGEAVLFKLLKAKGLQILSESAIGAPSVGLSASRGVSRTGPEPYGR